MLFGVFYRIWMGILSIFMDRYFCVVTVVKPDIGGFYCFIVDPWQEYKFVEFPLGEKTVLKVISRHYDPISALVTRNKLKKIEKIMKV